MNHKGREGDRKQILQLFESRKVNSKLLHMQHRHIQRTHTVYDADIHLHPPPPLECKPDNKFNWAMWVMTITKQKYLSTLDQRVSCANYGFR